ncbi:MAG: hypothetical protein PHF00_01155 [Elusimicrobia bacterium]|nr:hypothetical protein [Elusimicrobiota bacterium]
MSGPANVFERALHKALEETASAAVKAGGSRLRVRVLPQVMASPAAGVISRRAC